MRTTEPIGCRRHVHPPGWAPIAPVLRDGRVQIGVPRRPVFAFAEGDYCYGIGTLTMKVDRIDWDHPVPYEGDIWLEVQGRIIHRTGQQGARRTVLVRAGLLPLRPPRRRPRRRP
jgi:hypothetical protein